MLNSKSELTNWGTTTKQRNTNWHQKCVTKILKNPYFCSAKMVPEEVVLFLTLEVVLKLTLESQKSGTKTNSPAYIYIYISLSISFFLFLYLYHSSLCCSGDLVSLRFPLPISVDLCMTLRVWECMRRERGQIPRLGQCASTARPVAPVLRGPAAILFVSRDSCRSCRKSISCLFFMGYRTVLQRYVAKWGISHRCACVKLSTKGGVSQHFGSANLPKKVSRDMGYRSDSIAISRDMGPLSSRLGLWTE